MAKKRSLQGGKPSKKKPNPLLAVVDSISQPSGDGFAMDSSLKYGSGFGTAINDETLGWFAGMGNLGYQINALLMQNGLINKCCWLPARDAVRVGWKLAGDVDDELSKAFQMACRKHKTADILRDIIQFGRGFGVRHVLFKYNGPNADTYYANPYNPKAIKKGRYGGMIAIDPQWVSPTDIGTNPIMPRFYEPHFYNVNGKRIHHSHIYTYIPFPVADVLKSVYQYAGMSIPQMIYERVYGAERTANEAPLIAMTMRTFTLGTDQAAISGEGADTSGFEQRMQDAVRLRNNFGTMTYDKDMEAVGQIQTSLAGIDETIMTQYQLAAVTAGIPATKLLEMQPKGFNSTGDYEAESYRMMLEAEQEAILPCLDRHLDMLYRSEIQPKFGGSFDDEVCAVWNPLDSPTAVELADIQLKNQQRDMGYQNMGAITAEEVRDRLQRDETSPYAGSLNEDWEMPDEEAEPEEGQDPATANGSGEEVPADAPERNRQDGSSVPERADD